MSVTMGNDRVFRSTETLNGFYRDSAEAINDLARRCRALEEEVCRLRALENRSILDRLAAEITAAKGP